MASAHVIVAGRVQGVGFRWYTVDRARGLGLSGWVANLDDGRVEVCADGEAAAVDQLIDWLRHGPPSARVDNVLVDRDATPRLHSAERLRVDFGTGRSR